MNEEDRKKITSNEYADLIVEYDRIDGSLERFRDQTIVFIDDKYAVIYFPVSLVSQRLVEESGYSSIPKLFGTLETTSLEEMGVIRVQNTPFLGLKGQGVLLGFVDTGIEYTNPLFKNADNTSRIVSIWDQSIENLQATQDIFYYGAEYSNTQINQALQNENPLSIVPSTDEIGHGTMLAGLAGGAPIEESDFIGVVPLAEYVIVKLKPAKPVIKSFFLVPEETLCYQENDIMFGIQYLYRVARDLKRPIAICIGVGTNQGSHDGRSSISDMISTLANRTGTAIIVAAGNEGNSGHHFFSLLSSTIGYDTVELKVAEDEHDFSMELWGNVPGIYSVDIVSPSGEYIPRIPARLGENRVVQFLFEKTTLRIDYLIVEAQTGDQLILFRFVNPAPGIWKFRVYGVGDIISGFHIWLPMRGFISEDTVFLRPDPNTTITTPGNTAFVITVTAYNHKNQSLYRNASRGFSRTNIVKPELTAPGVEVYSPTLGGQYENKSGTSISAALTTGVSAMLLEWGIVNQNFTSLDTIQIKKMLIRGVKRSVNMEYPNPEWGYGIIDIYRTFLSLRGET
jgi:subtilisin family serine protease